MRITIEELFQMIGQREVSLLIAKKELEEANGRISDLSAQVQELGELVRKDYGEPA